MKEDDGNGKKAGAEPAPQDPTSGKIEKDMKGLVYQGGGSGGPQPDYNMPPEAPKAEKDGGDYQDTPSPNAEKDDTILTFTEKESKSKIIVLAIVIVVIIAGIAYAMLHSNGAGKSTTIFTTISGSNAPTSTAGPNYNKTVIDNINLYYNYTGPSSVNKTSCQVPPRDIVINYHATVAASNTFLLPAGSPVSFHTSGPCQLTIAKISISTPGFRIVSINPALPFKIQANSQVQLVIQLKAPYSSYTGPLTMTVNEH